jgi:hypothetical protein
MGKLINYQYVKLETDISQNVPETELDNPIKRSQEMLEMVIGASLVAELVSQDITLPKSFSSANTTLMDYVKPFLAWQAYQFWLPKANFKSHASGLRVHEEDNSRAASEGEMANLIRDAKMWAQTKKEKLVQFLEDNCTTYPLYDCVNCGGKNKRTGTGFHITGVGKHAKDCTCYSCRYGYS